MMTLDFFNISCHLTSHITIKQQCHCILSITNFISIFKCAVIFKIHLNLKLHFVKDLLILIY
jgi:hypothetical protein